MRVTHLIFLSFAFGIGNAIELKVTTPSFSLANERSLDGSPKINVVFPNGKSDSMILSKTDSDLELEKETGIEACRYLGHLENDPDACLAMTGCPGSDDVEFTILSDDPESSGLFRWTKEGKVEKTDEQEGIMAGIYPADPPEVPADRIVDPPLYPAFHDIDSESEEMENRNSDCPYMELILKNGVKAKRGSFEGDYKKSSIKNGKPTYEMVNGDNAIWYVSGYWLIGDSNYIGKLNGGMYSYTKHGLDDSRNVWNYHTGIAGSNDVDFKCKQKPSPQIGCGKHVDCGGHDAYSCEMCTYPNYGSGWCNGDCKYSNGKCVLKNQGKVLCSSTSGGRLYAESCEACMETHKKCYQHCRKSNDKCIPKKLPGLMNVDLKIGYGDGLVVKVPSKSTRDNKIREVMTHAQTYYCKGSLGTKIKLSYGQSFKHYNGYDFYSDDVAAPDQLIPEPRSGYLDYLTKRDLGSDDLMVFFDYDTNTPQKDTTAGVAGVGTVCKKQGSNDASKWSMNEWRDNMNVIGTIVAHEMGHNFGLSHNKSGCKGPMDASVGADNGDWSSCSKSSFLTWYRKMEKDYCWCLDTTPKKCPE